MTPCPSAPNFWRRLDDLFNRTLELDPALRLKFVDEVCGGDVALREELLSLLQSAADADQTQGFIEAALSQAAHQVLTSGKNPVLTEGSRFANYQILSMLGSGGMGQVYLARDLRLPRKAALKILRPDSFQGQDTLRRFEQESRAASALNHPNILTIYEVGEFEGVLFIASEFVDGSTIRRRLV